MAANNSKITMEYDKTMYKKPSAAEKKNHLAGRINKFQEKVNETQHPQAPVLSEHEQHVFDQNLMHEIKKLCELVKDHGQQGDYAVQIKFGELLPLYGNASDKLVSILLPARKQGYVNFSGDTLAIGRDEDVYIKLIKTPY